MEPAGVLRVRLRHFRVVLSGSARRWLSAPRRARIVWRIAARPFCRGVAPAARVGTVGMVSEKAEKLVTWGTDELPLGAVRLRFTVVVCCAVTTTLLVVALICPANEPVTV